MLSLLLNVVVGAMIGYMAQLVTIAIDCGAEMINMQMGLSSATALDPTNFCAGFNSYQNDFADGDFDIHPSWWNLLAF